MKILRTRHEFEQHCEAERKSGRRIGLVPTMGALHQGHLSLVRRAIQAGDTVVASVFVNPTQFNNANDLVTYPRCEADDFALLESAGVGAVFAPTVEEMYPGGQQRDHDFDLGTVAEVMEGRYRPGHFQGVAQVVSRLMRMAGPCRAYFGQKDYQQIAVLRRMKATEGLDDVEIVACPIHRGEDGLAMSSRNRLLTPGQRKTAPGIYHILRESVDYSRAHSVEETRREVVERVNRLPECRVEYFEIADADTLQGIARWTDADSVIGCITVYCGQVRLIDNIFYRPLPEL